MLKDSEKKGNKKTNKKKDIISPVSDREMCFEDSAYTITKLLADTRIIGAIIPKKKGTKSVVLLLLQQYYKQRHTTCS